MNKNSSKWISIWLASVIIVLIGVPPQGVVVVAASSPLFLYHLWRIWREKTPMDWRSAAFAAACLLFFFVRLQGFRMCLGALRYVLENGPINQVAYGLPWNISLNGAVGGRNLFEFLRATWIIIPAICADQIIRAIKEKRFRQEFPAAAICSLILCFLLIPYTMGRIDPGALSRLGVFTIFVWTGLFPLILRDGLSTENQGENQGKKSWVIVAFVMVLFVAPLSGEKNRPATLDIESALAPRLLTGDLKNGEESGLSPVGRGSVGEEYWAGLIEVKSLLEKYLEPRQPYLDLTGRHARYFYLDRLPHLEVTAPYNLVPLPQQRRIIEELKEHPRRIALISTKAGNSIYDGGGLALRNPILYRFVLDQYEPFFEKGYILGRLKDRPSSPGATSLKTDDAQSEEREKSAKKFVVTNFRIEKKDEPPKNEGAVRSNLQLEDPALAQVLKPSDSVYVADQELNVLAVDPIANKIEVTSFSEPINSENRHLKFEIGERERAYRAALFEKAITISDLVNIPISWGRSFRSLEKRMSVVKDVTQSIRTTQSSNSKLPIWKSQSVRLSGEDADLLVFEFECANSKKSVPMKVHWQGRLNNHLNTSLDSTLTFRVASGTLIVPLDANPKWSLDENVEELQLELLEKPDCENAQVRGVKFYRRRLTD